MALDRVRFVAAVALVAALLPAASAAQTSPSDPSDRLFDDRVLHDLYLTISDRDWSTLKEHYLEFTYYPCDLKWNDVTVRNVGIRSYGTGSRRPAKPSLRFDFDRFALDQTFVGLKSFILRNNAQDPSGMRERLSMLMFRRMGTAAEREVHARLFVNNVYSGIFTIVESIDRDFLRKQLTENAGHLFEYHFNNSAAIPFGFGYPGSDPMLYVPAPFKPKTAPKEQGDVLERLFWTINNASDAVWRSAMNEFLDLSKFMRQLGIENFLAEEDGITGDYGPNNFWLYRAANANRFVFLPFDKSNTFWNTPYFIFQNLTTGIPSHRNLLVLRAMGYSDLKDVYEDTVLECANSILADPSLTPNGVVPPGVTLVPAPPGQPGWLEAEIAREYAQIRQATLNDPVKPFTNEQFEQSVLDLTNFARHRAEYVRQQVADERAQRGR